MTFGCGRKPIHAAGDSEYLHDDDPFAAGGDSLRHRKRHLSGGIREKGQPNRESGSRLDLFIIQSRNDSLELRTHRQVLQQIFAYIECYPHIVEFAVEVAPLQFDLVAQHAAAQGRVGAVVAYAQGSSA